MRQMKIGFYKELTEIERRAKYSGRISILGVSSSFGVLIILFSTVLLNSSRECPEMHALETGICRACIDRECLSCEEDSK